ncbi:MAG: M56 family metallopeptidase [Bacteroidales bacterium]|nr:M56 family metallopeptidase [Bacteroidales bacterium]
MTTFLLYILRSSLYLAVFYAFFLLVMRRTSLFRFNRIMLLAGSAACFVLPLIRLRPAAAAATDAVAAGPLTAVAAAAEPLAAASARAPWLLLLYVAGALAVLALTGLSALRLARLIRSGRTTREDGYRLTLVDGDVSSFSWGRHIVMSRSDLEANPAILTHERMHVQKKHSLDIAFFSVITILHWFNPLVWITYSELKLLHEYEADEGVIDNGIDATQYQLLLVKKAVGEHRFSLANGFRHSKLKNRIAMMIKPHSSAWMRLAYGALLPVMAVLMFACNPAREQQKEEQLTPADIKVETKVMDQADAANEESVPYQEIEVKPTFNGSDAGAFSEWVNSHLTYPEASKAAGEQGRVTLQFTVGSDGVVRDVKVLRGASEALDAEAVRVISSSPNWEPGMQDGKAVAVTYTFPVVFKLK